MFNKAEMGKRIIELRKEKDLTQDQMAEKLGITVDSVSNYERGVTFCGPVSLVEIAEILGTTTDYLLTGRADNRTDTLDRRKIYEIGKVLIALAKNELK